MQVHVRSHFSLSLYICLSVSILRELCTIPLKAACSCSLLQLYLLYIVYQQRPTCYLLHAYKHNFAPTSGKIAQLGSDQFFKNTELYSLHITQSLTDGKQSLCFRYLKHIHMYICSIRFFRLIICLAYCNEWIQWAFSVKS